MLRRIGAVLLLLLISTGFACAAGEPALNPNGYYIENTHEFQQDVSGEGLKKIMKINAVKKDYKEVSDWLPCCFGGYFDMSDYEHKLLSEDGVFDCSCRATSLKTYKPAWDGSTAQFPNEVYQSKP